jgi:hypothetical protein
VQPARPKVNQAMKARYTPASATLTCMSTTAMSA